jgi:tRNA (guanine9-N1)-methyltransferase
MADTAETHDDTAAGDANNEPDQSDNDVQTNATTTLSKNQLKKQRKNDMRQLAKQTRKLESKKRKAGVLETETDISTGAPVEVKPPQYIVNEKSRNERKLKDAEENAARCARNFSIIIDCAWEDKHTESTLKSLTQQIMFCYGINRKHECPAPLYLTGVGPRVTANLSKSNFKNWVGVTITSDDYINNPDFSLDATEGGKQKQLVYLTSDAEETLETLDPSCAYIIGGIVDRNKHKFATFTKAKTQNVRTAKLPIKENFALAATHILTVNHVYEILLNYAKYKCWVRAIKEVMPNRKCPVEREDGTGAAAGAVDEEGEQECRKDGAEVQPGAGGSADDGANTANTADTATL